MFTVKPSTRVKFLRQAISAARRVPVDRIDLRLGFGGTFLQDDRSLGDYGITSSESFVYVLSRGPLQIQIKSEFASSLSSGARSDTKLTRPRPLAAQTGRSFMVSGDWNILVDGVKGLILELEGIPADQ